MYKWITGGTANKDFIGLRKIESWFNFSCSMTGKKPAIHTAHAASLFEQPARLPICWVEGIKTKT